MLAGIIADDPTIVRTLEVGCAYGLSSLYICLGTRGRPGASRTILDPFQYSEWHGAGVKALADAGIDFFHLVELRSEFGLPQILADNEGAFDFVFVDGFHTFDHTLLDCFYASRLLRVGGYLVVDDVGYESVSRAVAFVRSYPCYDFHGSATSPRRLKARRLLSFLPRRVWAHLLTARFYRRVFGDHMVALKKIAEDKRGYDWHDDRFIRNL